MVSRNKDFESLLDALIGRIETCMENIRTQHAWGKLCYSEHRFLFTNVFAVDSYESAFIEKSRLTGLIFQLKELFSKIQHTPEGKRFLRKHTDYQPLLENIERRAGYLITS